MPPVPFIIPISSFYHLHHKVPLTPEQYQDMRLQKEMWERNRPLTDEELDAMLPSEKEGYKVGKKTIWECSPHRRQHS